MAEMTTAQKQALGGMNLSSDEEKLEELKAIEAKIKAEEARIKANIAEKKAAEANARADMQLMGEASGIEDRAEMANQPVEETIDRGFGGKYDDIPLSDREKTRMSDNALITQARGLMGDRDEDGSLIPALDEQPVREMTEDEQKLYDALMAGEELTDELQIIANNMSMKDFEDTGIPVVQRKVIQVEEDDIPVEEDDIETDERTDAESENRRFGGIDREEGRAESVESEARGEKPGWEMAEGGNTWSVNEKDPYWKTQEGYDEAVDLYGKKPSFLKEQDVATLIYNPSTGEYEEVEEEEFEDLSRPAVSADIKKLFG